MSRRYKSNQNQFRIVDQIKSGEGKKATRCRQSFLACCDFWKSSGPQRFFRMHELYVFRQSHSLSWSEPAPLVQVPKSVPQAVSASLSAMVQAAVSPPAAGEAAG